MVREIPLARLLEGLETPVRAGRGGDVMIRGITTRSEDVEPGTLFVALPGTGADGHTYIADAARRGAAAILVEREVGGAPGGALVRVEDAHRALAELAALWHGRPAERLTLVGITGTAGKTSTLALLEAILVAGGLRVGSVGSLGVHVQGKARDSSVYTTPDPLLLHRELARLEAAGSRIVAMEATSHALAQDRVHGLHYALGIFTNLLPLEHSDYHHDFRDYVAAKSRFFDHLDPDAPLIYNADDPGTRGLVEPRALVGIPVGQEPDAAVVLSTAEVSHEGTRLRMRVARPIPRVDGGTVDPCELDIRLRLLGGSNVVNAALAAASALSLGVDPGTIPGALAGFEPPRRRMELIHRGAFTVLDDTVGHPESLTGVFRVIQALAPRRVRLVYAVRGQRGERINRENATTLAIWASRVPLETLVVTRSEEATDELNRVEDPEYEAFLAPLLAHGLDVREEGRLDAAVATALDRAESGDLVALLGAQGMDRGREHALDWLAQREGSTA